MKTPAGIFDNCISLGFDVPQAFDEEIIYTFAPNIGIVKIQYNGWYSSYLTSVVIDGRVIGNINY